ncbi:MAG: flagellar protein FlaG [Clostridiaceae bacterium]|jgi:flagellar protein FlaG|nr:flagellar protein FlaG [Clostridiaceae bacterium]
MKIDSMDATRLQPVRNQSTDHSTKNNQNTPETKIIGNGQKEQVSDKAVTDAIEKANRAISITRTQMEFSIHEKTKEIMVKVINSDTKEVIREIPQEKILDMVAKMWEMAGILVDERR